MRERCPSCQYRFERAEAFFLGAYTINLAITEGLLAILTIVPCIVLLAGNPNANITPVWVSGLVAAVMAPVFFYPNSKTIWTAIDMLMGPATDPEPARD